MKDEDLQERLAATEQKLTEKNSALEALEARLTEFENKLTDPTDQSKVDRLAAEVEELKGQASQVQKLKSENDALRHQLTHGGPRRLSHEETQAKAQRIYEANKTAPIKGKFKWYFQPSPKGMVDSKGNRMDYKHKFPHFSNHDSKRMALAEYNGIWGHNLDPQDVLAFPVGFTPSDAEPKVVRSDPSGELVGEAI